MKAPGVEPGAQAPSLSLRALFCYFRRASSESELNQFSELTLFLPRRSGSLQVEGDDVGPAEASLQLRREKTGVYVNMSSLLVTGPCLPFEIGVRTGAEEQRWLVGELRHFDGGEGGRPGGWGLRCSTTAAQGGAFLRDLCADIEVLVCCDVAPGHPACISAHAQLPTVGGRTLRMRGRRPSSLEVIAEDEKARRPNHHRGPPLSAPWGPRLGTKLMRYFSSPTPPFPQCEPPSLEQPGTLGRTASDAGDRASPFEAQESLEWDPSGGEGDFLSESWLGDYQGSLGA